MSAPSDQLPAEPAGTSEPSITSEPAEPATPATIPRSQEGIAEKIARITGTTVPTPGSDGQAKPAAVDGTYGRDEAAEVLGVSPRRVTQLAAQGELDVISSRPLVVTAQSVEERRVARRRASDRPARESEELTPSAAEQVAEQVERLVGLVADEMRKVHEAEALLIVEITKQRDHLKAEVIRLRAELDEERRTQADPVAPAARGWRKPGK